MTFGTNLHYQTIRALVLKTERLQDYAIDSIQTVIKVIVATKKRITWTQEGEIQGRIIDSIYLYVNNVLPFQTTYAAYGKWTPNGA
jgi:hypothetical protein